MMRVLLLALALIFGAAATRAETHPEARPFVESANAQVDLDAALASASERVGQNVILVMGANWCHDSRALAGWFASPRFAAMLRDRYQIVYIDAGNPQVGKGRNLDIAKRFGIKAIKGTPLVMVVSPSGKLLNSKKDAASWRNAASRSEDDIFAYFSAFTSG
jgi:Thioredoxin-like